MTKVQKESGKCLGFEN